MFPINVTDSCPGAVEVPIVPLGVFLAVFYGFVPWVISHCFKSSAFEYEHVDGDDAVWSISRTIRSVGGLMSTILAIGGIIGYSVACLREDRVVMALIITGSVILLLVAFCNGNPESDETEQVIKTMAHKFAAAAAFIYIPVVMCLIVYYLSQVESLYRDRAIASYIIISFGAFFFFMMLISMVMSEDRWHPIFTGLAEWALGGAFLAIICLPPGQLSQ